MGLAYLKSRKAVYPPPEPLVWETPHMSVSFRDYIYSTAHTHHDAEPALIAAMNEAARFEPEAVFPLGTYQWSVGTGSLDCFIERYTRRGIMTFGGWMESLSRMWLFNQNYRNVSFAVDISAKETDAQGRTYLYDQGDCYLIL